MPNVYLIPDASTSIEALTAVVDGFPQTQHTLELTTGGEPLEDGTEVVDHAVVRQAHLTLTGWVSDLNGGQRPAEAWDAIGRLQKILLPIEVLTEWKTYPQMLIQRAAAQYVGRGMRFTLELSEIIRVGVAENDLPEPVLQGGPAEGRSGVIPRGRVTIGELEQVPDPPAIPPPAPSTESVGV